MAVGIPLPELDVSKPTPAPFPDALAEFQRASQLQTAAAQQQQIQAQTTGVQQQNQLTALQVKDMQTIHDLAPQFVQKDENGKPTGFDNEGFANAARGAGVNPLIVNTMQQQYAATVKSLADAGKAQIDTEKDRNANAFEASQDMRAVSRKLYGQSSAPATAAPGATPAPAQPGGVPPLAAAPSGIPGLQGGAPLVNGQIAASPAPAVPSAVPPIGSAPAGSPESLGKPPDGEAATPTESSLQAVGPQASPEDMSAYHQFLMKMMRLNVNISQLDPNHIPTEKQLDSFQAGLGAHAQAAADAEQAAKTQASAAKGRLDDAEAGLKNIQLNLAKNATPGSFDQQIDGIFPPTNAVAQSQNIMLKGQINAALSRGDVDSAKKIVAGALENVQGINKDIAVATNPQIQAGKVEVARNTAAAVMGVQAGGVPLAGAPAVAAQAGPHTPQDLQAAVPANIRPTVLAITEGRMSPPGSFALKQPYWQNVMNNVFSLDPQWNEQRAQLRKSYTVGKQSGEINDINTAMAHAGVLGDAIDNLNNTDMQVWNRLANAVGVQVGQTPVTTFNTIVHRLAPELASAYGQNTGTERDKVEGDLQAKLGPDQLKNNLGVTVGLIRGKIGSLENQWDQNSGPGVPAFQDRFIMPAAKHVLDKWAPQGAGAGGQGQAGAQQFSHVSASGKFGWNGTQWVPIPGK